MNEKLCEKKYEKPRMQLVMKSYRSAITSQPPTENLTVIVRQVNDMDLNF